MADQNNSIRGSGLALVNVHDLVGDNVPRECGFYGYSAVSPHPPGMIEVRKHCADTHATESGLG